MSWSSLPYVITELPPEVISLIFSFIPVENSNWLHVLLTCRIFLHVGRRVFDPSIFDNSFFVEACCYGQLEAVRHLMKDPRINVAVDNNWPIIVASENGHLAVVQELLKDPRVDPSTHENTAFNWAIRFGHHEVANLLLQHPKVCVALT